MNDKPAWLIWRVEASEKHLEQELKAGAARFQQKFGSAPNVATISAKASPGLVERVQQVLGADVKTSRYLFNPNEVLLGYEAAAEGQGEAA